MRLGGKVAVVTGGGSGIGRGVALCMAREGAAVAIPDVDLDGAAGVAREIEALGGRALPLRMDVTRRDEVEAMVGEVRGKLGRLDVLVNNAGVPAPPGLPFTNNVEADWDRVYEVNVKGIFLTSKAVAPHFIEQKAGRIVNIASIAGPLASPTSPPYTVSKAGVITFTRIVARELAPHGITVNAICPGVLWTPFWEALGAHIARTNPAFANHTPRQVFDRRVADLVPMKREQTPEDIGWAAVFFASEEARNVTGQALCVDGGCVMH